MGTALMEGKQLVGLPVVDATSGDDIAEIRDVVFDPASGRLTGFTLNKRGEGRLAKLFAGRRQETLMISDVASVGSHAVMVRSGEAMREPTSGDAVAEADPKKGDVSDDRVVTVSGRELGTVIDVIVMAGADPRVVGYRLSTPNGGDAFVPMSEQRAVSGSALIVPDDFAERLRPDLGSFSVEVAAIDQGAS